LGGKSPTTAGKSKPLTLKVGCITPNLTKRKNNSSANKPFTTTARLLKLFVRKNVFVPLAVAIVLTLGIVFNNAFNDSPTTVSEVCNQEGITKTSSGNDLICEKNGSNLTWVDKSNTSLYAVGPTSRLVYRYVGDKQQRLNLYQIWQEEDPRADSDFDPIRVAAYKSITSGESDSTHQNIQFDYLIRPGFPQDISDSIKIQLKQSAARLSPFFKKKIEIKVILVTEKDKNFIKKELPNIVPENDWQGALDNIYSYSTTEEFYSRGGTGGGTASFLPDKGFGYYIGHTSSLATIQTYWPEVAPHELTHVVQGFFANGFASNYPDGHPKAKWSRHLIEGSANTVGMGLGFSQLGWYSDEMDNLLSDSINYARSDNYSTFDRQFPMKNVDDAVDLIKKMEAVGPGYSTLSDLSYSAGQFVWEFYIGKYGLEKYIQLLTSLDGSTLNAGLMETIGLNKDQFYQEAAPYLLSNWQRLSS